MYIITVCWDHTTVKIIWFWLKFQCSGKTVMYEILAAKNGCL